VDSLPLRDDPAGWSNHHTTQGHPGMRARYSAPRSIG